MFMLAYVYACVCVRACAYVCVLVYVRACVCMGVYSHTHSNGLTPVTLSQTALWCCNRCFAWHNVNTPLSVCLFQLELSYCCFAGTT